MSHVMALSQLLKPVQSIRKFKVTRKETTIWSTLFQVLLGNDSG